MPNITSERYALMQIERVTGRRMSIPEYQLMCIQDLGLNDTEAAARIDIPVSTYKKWKGKNIQSSYRLREPAAAGR